jgi:membrane dipeptidase
MAEIIIDGLNSSFLFKPWVLKELCESDVDVASMTVAAWHNRHQANKLLDKAYRLFAENDDKLVLVKDVSDIERARVSGKLGLILNFQDTAPLDSSVDLLDGYYKKGVRMIQLTYNNANAAGSGYWVKNDGGLTRFGREVVKRMNDLEILIDLSHCGDITTLEAIEESDQPVCISHANSRYHCGNPRNKSDEAIKRLTEKGGVIGAMNLPLVLNNSSRARLRDYVDSIGYLVDLVGVDHVGIGTDFMRGMPWYLKALIDDSDIPTHFNV